MVEQCAGSMQGESTETTSDLNLKWSELGRVMDRVL